METSWPATELRNAPTVACSLRDVLEGPEVVELHRVLVGDLVDLVVGDVVAVSKTAMSSSGRRATWNPNAGSPFQQMLSTPIS